MEVLATLRLVLLAKNLCDDYYFFNLYLMKLLADFSILAT